MLSKKLQEMLNKQINMEFFSSYLYLSFSNHFTEENLDGFANWYEIQATEEKDHAVAFMQYMKNNGAKIVLEAIEKPQADFKDTETVLNMAYEHEKLITASINKIYGVALEEKDYRTMEFLAWFIKEQGEEEKNADELIHRYKLFGQDDRSLYLLDREFAARSYNGQEYEV